MRFLSRLRSSRSLCSHLLWLGESRIPQTQFLYGIYLCMISSSEFLPCNAASSCRKGHVSCASSSPKVDRKLAVWLHFSYDISPREILPSKNIAFWAERCHQGRCIFHCYCIPILSRIRPHIGISHPKILSQNFR